MNLKILFGGVFILTLVEIISSEPKKGLLRKPKVYNAVITTDDNLAPSRAYPLIQPIIHETPIAFPYATYTSSFTPGYRLYDYSSQLYPGSGLASKQTIESRNNKNIENHESVPEEEIRSNENVQLRKQSNINLKNENDYQNPSETDSNDIKTEKPPIPLNEYGLPPSLVPLAPFGTVHHQNHFNLQPYPYTTYPLIYESFNGYQSNPLLPHYGYYPQSSIIDGGNNKKKKGSNQIDQNINSNEFKESISTQQQTKISMSDVINFANKNNDIPDVPPPPLPTARSSKQN